MREKEWRSSKVFLAAVGVGLLLLLIPGVVQADLPETINYQGRLAASGGGLINGTVAMSFSIYNVKTGGTALWTESYAAVQVTNGQFSVDLGSVVALDLPFDEKYWLGITVGTDPEMTPRKPFTSVGYAVRSLHAQDADHSSQSDNSSNADNATDSDHADTADYATTAGHASTADTATSATTATLAATATLATSALSADDATHADAADHATTADDATHADSADHATTADDATHATSADHATTTDTVNYALGVNEEGVAVVTTGLRSGGSPGPGLAVYTDPTAALSDLSNWCPTPSESSPCLLKIMPGVYNLGATPLSMESWVDIEGSGEDVTILRTSETVHSASNSGLRSLTLDFQTGMTGSRLLEIQDEEVRIGHLTINAPSDFSMGDESIRISGGPPPPDGPISPEISHLTISLSGGTGIYSQDTSPRLSHITILADAITDHVTGVRNEGSYASPSMTDITITGTGDPGDITGVLNDMGASPVMSDVDITIQFGGGGGGGRTATGVRNQNSSPKMTDVRVSITGSEDDNLHGVANHAGSAPAMHDVIITLQHTGTGTTSHEVVGIDNHYASLSMTNVQVDVGVEDCGGSADVYGVRESNSDLVMRSSVVTIEILTGGCSTGSGISIDTSNADIFRSLVNATGSGPTTGVGMTTDGTSVVRIDHSIISGGMYSIWDISSTGDPEHIIGHTKLIGNVQDGGGGSFECLGAYTEDPGGNLQELDPSCH